MSESTSKVDSDPASPTTNPIKTGKRGTDDVTEPFEFVYSKKQKIVKQNKVEVTSCINSAITTQDAERASISNEDEDHHKLEIPQISVSTEPTQDAERVSISNEYDEQDIDGEVYQHLEKTPINPKIVLMDNLNLSVKEEDVKKFFKIAGEIVQVHFEMREGRFLGYGHAEFTTTEAAQEALKLNNELLLDHPVRLNLATTMAEHEHEHEHEPEHEHEHGHNTIPHTTGSKTVFLGNLSFSIEEDDVRDFFKDVGEIAAIRFAIRDQRFLGHGHIEFTTADSAQKALKLHKEILLNRQVTVVLARERGAYTPRDRMEKSQQTGSQSHGKTIYVRGFDSSESFENVRSALEKHFGKCGEISRLCIPKDYESGALKGLAFIDFTSSNGVSEALGLDGCEVGGKRLTVEKAKNPKHDDRQGYGGGSGWARGNGPTGGWARGNGPTGVWARESGSGSGWHRDSGSGRSWHKESGSVRSWHREIGFGSGSHKESGSGRSWHREIGFGSGLHRESGSGRSLHRENSFGSGSSRSLHRESGSGTSWHRESGSGSRDGYGGGGSWVGPRGSNGSGFSSSRMGGSYGSTSRGFTRP